MAANRKRASEAAESRTSASKKQKRNNNPSMDVLDILPGVDVTAPDMGTTFWNTVVMFINNGSKVEDHTLRWQSLLENMHLIGTAQRRKTGAVDGQIPLSALKSLQNAAKALPYEKAQKQKKPSKSKPIVSESEDEDEDHNSDSDDVDDHESEVEETPSKSTRRFTRFQGPATPPQTPPEQVINSKKKVSSVLSPREGAWRSTLISIMQPHSTLRWAAGFTNVITRTFSHESVNDIVKFLDELYRTKNSIAINNGSKTVQALKNSKDQARQVVLKFKALWSAVESAALSQCYELFAYHDLGIALCQLETELDKVGHLPVDQLSVFAQKYLESRGGEGSRRRDTEKTRATFIADHLLEVLDFNKESGRSEEEVKEKKRLLKTQRMTAKNIKAFADCFGEGCLLLMWRSAWPSALPQVSDTTVKPLLDKLAADEPHLREMSALVKRILKYAKDKRVIATMPKILLRAQEVEVEKRSRLPLKELLGPPEAELQAAQLFAENTGSDDEFCES